MSISSSFTSFLFSTSTAPPTNFDVINSLNLPATIPIFIPFPLNFPSNFFIFPPKIILFKTTFQVIKKQD